MKNLPPLSEVIKKEIEPKFDFKWLMSKLFTNEGKKKGYLFEPNPPNRHIRIDGIVKDRYPDVNEAVIFQFKWLEASLSGGAISQQIRKSFELLMELKVPFNYYILVTPEDLIEEDRKWLENFRKEYNVRAHHYGNTEIQRLLKLYPAIRKYYYGRHIEGVEDFKLLKEKYKKSTHKSLKDLEFIGLPTAQYQSRDLLKRTELKKIFIPLELKSQGDKKTTKLSQTKEKFNRVVVMGEPGAGKSTFVRHLTLEFCRTPDDEVEPIEDEKIPFIIFLSDFVRMQRAKPSSFNFVDYLKYYAESNLHFKEIDIDFFEAMMSLGQAVIIFDGLDEIVSEQGRIETAREIKMFSDQYPESRIWSTTRSTGYTNDIKLELKKFKHFQLSRVTLEQAKAFVEKWFEVQLPSSNDKQARTEKVKSLISVLEGNVEIQKLSKNPLFLTMMVILHQHDHPVLNDRPKLFEHCLELLLRTWPQKKYHSMGMEGPIEKRGIKYPDQLRLISFLAFHIQNKSHGKVRGLIEEKELLDAFFRVRYDSKRMSEDTAKKDINLFLEHFHERTGLLVEHEKRVKGERIFSFVHLSFLDYLCAYKIANDKSKPWEEHAGFLLKYLGDPTWEEIILQSVYLFFKSYGTSFIDEFYKGAIKILTDRVIPEGWFLLGRAIRDNLILYVGYIERILEEILKQWLGNPSNSAAFQILEEIAKFSRSGNSVLESIIKENIKNNKAERAFASLFLLNTLFAIDSSAINSIENNIDKTNFLSYLPICRGDNLLFKYIFQNLNENYWATFYNSVKDRTLDNLNQILKNEQINEQKLKGYIISCWSKIFSEFYNREHFFSIHCSTLDDNLKIGAIELDFGYAKIFRPLLIFRQFMNMPKGIFIKRISNDFFKDQDRSIEMPSDQHYLERWLNESLSQIFSSFGEKLPANNKFNQNETENITRKSINFGQQFGKIFNLYFNKYVNQDVKEFFYQNLKGDLRRDLTQNLHRYLDIDFNGYLNNYFKRDFDWDFKRGFNKKFRKNMSLNLGASFGRYFGRDLAVDSNKNLSTELNYDFAKYLTNDLDGYFKDLVPDFYEGYKEKLNWRKEEKKKILTEDDCKKIHDLFIAEFDRENLRFIKLFYLYLYDYIFSNKLQISFKAALPKKQASHSQNIITLHKHHLSIINLFMIPFTFNFILSGDLNHFLIHLLADLNIQFVTKEKPDVMIILKAVEEYLDRNPFFFYLLNYTWEFYSTELNCQYQSGNDLDQLKLASFIINAAKLSLITDMPCSGHEWDKILIKAEKSQNPFVKISLTLYRLCNFEDSRFNTESLIEQLEKFKNAHPDYYQLIGFSEV